MKLLGILFTAVLLLTNGPSVYAAQEFPSRIFTQLQTVNQSLLHKMTSELTQSHIPKKGLQRLSGNVSDVVIHNKINDNKREYVLFSYKLNDKPRFGIQVYEDGSDGEWTYSTRSSMYDNPESPVQVLFNHLEKNPIPIAGIVNHPNIKIIKVNFKDGQSHLLPAKNGYFFDVIHRDFSKVVSVEGLDSSNRVVSVAWDVNNPSTPINE
ncbi:hypothetical protein P9G84_07770 [Brevibacillus centrosporus]|uniref:hypothetical protein n=1 Tax=Brevibacillus centrosporus TaxID=54910 RepID=UPI000F0A5B92|nr:hypothetical protein [Brevibacillus centrosporus]MEC2128895.1 hypothetical protein [Brevibacillus centrosporus]RNB67064.1 hypothetical protein EDM55_21210 [Brevibacillus centrosporus]GED35036.1 hypothetical protein BCE02nite_61770 [Brevibacillus centrosporus]